MELERDGASRVDAGTCCKITSITVWLIDLNNEVGLLVLSNLPKTSCSFPFFLVWWKSIAVG